MDYKGGKKHLKCDNGSILLAQRNGQILEKILDLLHLEVFPTTKAPLHCYSSSTFCNLSSLLRIESTSFTFPGPTVPWASVRGAAGLGRLALRWGSGSPKPQTPAPGQPLVGTDQPGNWVTPRPGRPLSQRLI